MARKRALGGGRKPLGPYERNIAPLAVRVRPETKEGLQRAAKQHGRSMSQEMQRALRYWIQLSEAPHITTLAEAVMAVAEQCESATGRRYVDDASTSAALKSSILALLPELLSSGNAAADPTRAKRIGRKAAEFVATILRDAKAERGRITDFIYYSASTNREIPVRVRVIKR
jgi:uncharacterized protein (DUF1778 family)